VTVRYSPRAARDLAEIADYWIDVSPAGARSIERGIRRTIDLISFFPRSGRVLEQRPDVRVMPVARHPYLVFYVTREDDVLVLHIRHGAREPIDPTKL
jgi:toxin ParE1/3/4